MLFLVLLGLCLAVHGLKAPVNAPQLSKLLSRNVRPQAAWSLRTKKEPARVIDVIDVLGRFSTRESFYPGIGYQRPKTGGLMNKEKFFESMTTKDKKFKAWPLDKDGNKFGAEGMSKAEIDQISKQLASGTVSQVRTAYGALCSSLCTWHELTLCVSLSLSLSLSSLCCSAALLFSFAPAALLLYRSAMLLCC
jgi:hypothetical protein